ncbi:hypothetical protein Pelo_5505 [Pelomyxa schiedti]|nr:hypothetical protein Pelo_5505 [Pelomyxa schiedti]
MFEPGLMILKSYILSNRDQYEDYIIHIAHVPQAATQLYTLASRAQELKKAEMEFKKAEVERQAKEADLKKAGIEADIRKAVMEADFIKNEKKRLEALAQRLARDDVDSELSVQVFGLDEVQYTANHIHTEQDLLDWLIPQEEDAAHSTIPKRTRTCAPGDLRPLSGFHKLVASSTPSSFARSTWRIKQHQESDGRVYNHRPELSDNYPVTLVQNIFGEFQDKCNTMPISRELYEITYDFCEGMSKHYSGPSGETARMNVVDKAFGRLGTNLGSLTFLSGAKTDLSLCEVFQQYKVMLLNVEIKTEPGTGGDAEYENYQYYAQSLTNFGPHLAVSCTCPAFLMDVVGTYVSVFGVVTIGNPPRPMSDLLWREDCRLVFHNPSSIENVARFLGALCTSIDRLREFYTGVTKINSLSQIAAIEGISLPIELPRKCKLPDGHTEIELEYSERLDERKLNFKATMKVNSSSGTASGHPVAPTFSNVLYPPSPQPISATATTASASAATAVATAGQQVMVKFIHKRYGIEAHDLLAQRNFAPRLYYVCTLPPDWVVVIMQWLEITPYYMCIHQQQLPDNNRPRMGNFKESLREAVNLLHNRGLVHGDLRGPNVGGIPLPGSTTGEMRPVLIDFDWSGPCNTTLYPANMNHAEIEWHPTARPCTPLLIEHDEWLAMKTLGLP